MNATVTITRVSRESVPAREPIDSDVRPIKHPEGA